MFPSRKEVQKIVEMYPSGTRIKLLAMNDPQAVPAGTTGTVVSVDGIGQIKMAWDNGSTLKLVPGEDEFEVIK